ncbi:MAG: transcriptional repressor [Lachnospiraceae bacterium]|nr:transcriptional repressor [Lachnospiraceae bacterium]
MTENGKTILDIIEKAGNHPTAEDIYQQVREKGKKMSMATVYNNLNSLVSEGLIRRVMTDGKSEHYDKTMRHDHLICDVCGKISDLMLDDLTVLLERQSGVRLKAYDLKLIYICEQCRKLQSAAEKEI